MCDNLYNSLSYKITSHDLTLNEKEKICKMAELLDQEKQEIIYMLILHHHHKQNNTSKVVYPYKIKQISDVIEIKLDALPLRLKQILYKFVNIIFQEKDIEVPVIEKEKPIKIDKKRGRKPKYIHTIILRDIKPREIYKKTRGTITIEQIQTPNSLNEENSTMLEFSNNITNDIHSSNNKQNSTQLLDLIASNKVPIYLESNITRNVQMIDYIEFGCLPSTTDIYCWHDRHDFTTSPIGIPIEYIPRKEIYDPESKTETGIRDYYLTYGIFCSFPCALAYIEEHEHESTFKNSKSLLYSLYYRLYGMEMNIKKAPSWQFLKHYGGSLSIDEFREAHCQANFIITENIKRPFMVAVGKYTETKKCGCL